MLSKKFRLPLTTNFDRIKKQGRMINGPLFGLLVSQQSNNGAIVPRSGIPLRGKQSKFGFIVSTKIDKRAVVRNRVKRLLSEAVRLNLDKIKPGCDIVFLAKKSIVGKSFEEVKKEVENRLRRAKILVI